MCGIAGKFYFNNQHQVNEQELMAAKKMLRHRGPDDEDIFMDGSLGFAHTRLSILDLSNNGHQPMMSINERYVIVYNGEIYNYLHLKNQLEKKGVAFKSTSDTEVVLKLFIEYGHNMLHLLHGMFAFAIWDKQEKSLFLARDRVGIKPLFLSFQHEYMAFASEIKGLFAFNVSNEIIEENINEYLLYRYVAGKQTLYKQIVKLLPGHYLHIKNDGSFSEVCWWNLANKIKEHPTIQQPVEWFTNKFDAAVKSHLMSDVPVGVLLSGGLDSGSICAALFKQHANNINTFNVGFNNKQHDESALAALLAKKLSFDFESILVEGDDLVESVLAGVYALDEPLIHQNGPQIFAISKIAKQKVSVLLSGEGADEFLGGYLRYKPLRHVKFKSFITSLLGVIPHKYISSRFDKLFRYYNIGSLDDMILLNASNNFPSDFKRIGLTLSDYQVDYRLKKLSEAKELYPKNPTRQAMYVDQHTYLQTLNDRNDRMTMAASIECRVPFLDHTILEGLGTLPDKWFFTGKKGKFLLKESYKEFLPPEILNFKKVGFSVPWVEQILKTEQLKIHWYNMHQSDLLHIGWLKNIDVKKLRDTSAFNNPSNRLLLVQIFFMTLWWNNLQKGSLTKATNE